MEPIILSGELLDIFPELGTGDKLEDEGLDGPKCGECPGTLPGLGTDSIELEGDGPVSPGLGTGSIELEGDGPVSPGLGTDSTELEGDGPVGLGLGTDSTELEGDGPVGLGLGTDSIGVVEFVLLIEVLLVEVFVYIIALEQTTIL